MGDYAKATQLWMDSMTLKLPYTANIVIPPSIVYFASVYLNDKKIKKEAVKYLRKLAKEELPLALFLLDEINESQLLDTISINSPLK